MKILMTAIYNDVTANNGHGGGSGSFFSCLYDELSKIHDVEFDSNPYNKVDVKYDLIISSHASRLEVIKNNPSPKLHIIHGFVPSEERPIIGADKYVSISKEVQDIIRGKGFESYVVPQPINIPKESEIGEINEECKNILVIKNTATRDNDFVFLTKKYNVRFSDMSIPISEQIKWADLVITLGRGALESMSYGRNVIIADNRFYQGRLGDGYIEPSNFLEIEYNNYSGRRFRVDYDKEWVYNEISKYSKENAKLLRGLMIERNSADVVINSYFTIMGL